MGVVYIPPEGSRCAADKMFGIIQKDLIHINVSDLPVCALLGILMQELNCRQ